MTGMQDLKTRACMSESETTSEIENDKGRRGWKARRALT